MIPAILIAPLLDLGVTLIKVAVKKFDQLPREGKDRIVQNKKSARAIINAKYLKTTKRE